MNSLDLPVPLSMKNLSLYVYNKNTHRTMISASPEGDRMRIYFLLLLGRYSMAWAITFVSASSWFDKSVSKLQYFNTIKLSATSSLELQSLHFGEGLESHLFHTPFFEK